MRIMKINALALVLFLTACDGLVDDTSTGKTLARLSGTMSGTRPDGSVRVAAVWKPGGAGYQLGGGSCAPWEAYAVSEQAVVQEVDGSIIEDNRFQVWFNGPPPDDAFWDYYGGSDWNDPEHPELSIPFEYASGVLVAYADRNDNGRLDRCDGPSCTDQVLGTSHGDHVPFGLPRDPAAAIELGLDDYNALPGGYQDSPTSVLFTTEPWQPYGAREIPAGYVVQRARADVASGQRFFDGFDPAMGIEIPLSDSPILDGFACDGGCIGSFVHGEAECPDLETGWCSAAPEMPPADAQFRGVQCRPVNGEDESYREGCNPVWSRVTWGCDRFAELWLGCPVPGPDAEPDLTWACLR
jgi:hypothetical protein